MLFGSHTSTYIKKTQLPHVFQKTQTKKLQEIITSKPTNPPTTNSHGWRYTQKQTKYHRVFKENSKQKKLQEVIT